MSKSTSGVFHGTSGASNAVTPPLFDNGHVTYESIAAHREEFMGKSVEQIGSLLKSNGYEFNVRDSKRKDKGSTAIILEITNSSKERNIKLDLTTPIIPYKGTGIFELNADYDEIKSRLAAHDISYEESTMPATDIDPPWTIIDVGGNFELFFAKNRLFKIILKGNFAGSLPNGINLDTTIDDAEEIDPTLEFDDWEEIYESANGYWLEDDLETRKLRWITIFIPALERDDFFKYDW